MSPDAVQTLRASPYQSSLAAPLDRMVVGGNAGPRFHIRLNSEPKFQSVWQPMKRCHGYRRNFQSLRILKHLRLVKIKELRSPKKSSRR